MKCTGLLPRPSCRRARRAQRRRRTSPPRSVSSVSLILLCLCCCVTLLQLTPPAAATAYVVRGASIRMSDGDDDGGARRTDVNVTPLPAHDAESSSSRSTAMFPPARRNLQDNGEDDDASSSSSSESSSDDSTLCPALVATYLLFATFSSLLASSLAYYSIREDSLLRTYLSHGMTVQADVISTDLARRKFGDEPETAAEYVTTYEYEQGMRPGCEDYVVRVRRTVRTRGGDVRHRTGKEMPHVPSRIELRLSGLDASSFCCGGAAGGDALSKRVAELEGFGNEDGLVAMGALSPPASMMTSPPRDEALLGPAGSMDAVRSTINNPRSMRNGGVSGASLGAVGGGGGEADRRDMRYADGLELLLLPERVRSGYPKRQIERSCEARQRLPTLWLVLFMLSIAAGCALLAVRTVQSGGDQCEQVGWSLVVLFLAVMVAEVPVLHFWMGEKFQSMLEGEYLESGEYVTPHERLNRCTSSITPLDHMESGDSFVFD